MALNTYDTNDILSSTKVNADFDGVARGKEMHYNAEWTPYTPTWTAVTGANPAIGNGTLNGRYLVMGKTVFVRIIVKMGSTTTYGTANSWLFALPFNWSTVLYPSHHFPFGNAQYYDNSAGTLYAGSVRTSYTYSNKIIGIAPLTTGTYVSHSALANVIPFTWATNDYITMSFRYEMV